MGQPYGHEYHRAGAGGSAGLMICAGCRQPIDNETQEWMSYQKPKNGDWGYVCWHRECRDDPKWAALDARDAQQAIDYAAMQADVAALISKWGSYGWSLTDHVEDAERKYDFNKRLAA